MSKEVKEVKELKSVVNDQEKKALDILIKAAYIGQEKSAFNLDEAIIIGNAKNVLQGLIN
tara:strand:- start:55 stop:234 length:180 start_codon:yes stop_codon:yes gene_type:complete